MTTADEIKAAIDNLPFQERAEIARHFHGWTTTTGTGRWQTTLAPES